MIHSLIHTSAPKTLSGSSGFGVVAQTENFPVTAIRQVTNLSGYQFSKQEICLEQNNSTVLYSHWMLPAENGGQHVLTRVAPCGIDPSGRPNRIAQHLVFDADEMQNIGPATIAKQFGWTTNWECEPRIINISSNLENNSNDIQPDEMSLSLTTVLKDSAQGRTSGAVLQLPNDKDPLAILSQLESSSDPTTRWAMFWTINTARTFNTKKHRLLLSVSGNPAEDNINELKISHFNLDFEESSNEVSTYSEKATPSSPERSSENRYIPPTAEENKKPDNPAAEPCVLHDTVKEEPNALESLECPSIQTEQQTPRTYTQTRTEETRMVPTVVALVISVVAMGVLSYLIYQSTQQSEQNPVLETPQEIESR